MCFNFVAVSKAIQAICTEDFASLGAAESNMHDPPSFAKVAKGMGDGWNFKNLNVFCADGADPPSKVREIGVHLASNKLPPCARKIVFQKSNLGRAA